MSSWLERQRIARKMRDQEEDRERLKIAVQGLLEQIDMLDSYTLSKDLDPYKAEACWDDAINYAKSALARSRFL